MERSHMKLASIPTFTLSSSTELIYVRWTAEKFLSKGLPHYFSMKQFDIRAKILPQVVNRQMYVVISATNQHKPQPEQISLSLTRGKLSGETVVQQVDRRLHGDH
jgi:hypothetical protein